MTRQRALKYASEVAARLRPLGGIIGTPNCNFEAVVVRRVWVFGSVAKGSPMPNDLDLLLEMAHAGRGRAWQRGQKLDKGYTRRFGIPVMPDSQRQALKWLTHGMKKVSRHTTDTEMISIDVKVLIYPRWDLDQ